MADGELTGANSARIIRVNDKNERIAVCSDDLIFQNEGKFKLVNPGLSTSIFNANEESWDG